MTTVEILHNVTVVRRQLQYAPAIFMRHGFADPRYLPGDTCARGMTYETWAEGNAAAEEAYRIGNMDADMADTPFEAELIARYRALRVRSVSTGDVVLVDGRPWRCDPFGWFAIDEAPAIAALPAANYQRAMEEAPRTRYLDPLLESVLVDA